MTRIRRPGPAPKPTEMKRRLGNPGKRALPAPIVALAPVQVLPATPAAGSGDELVSRLLDTAASAWISEPDRLVALELLREAWDERRMLRDYIADNGHSLLTFGEKTGERLTRRPESVRLERLEQQITGWISLLGLTPADRSRLGVAETKAKSRLEALRERREARENKVRAG